MRKRINGLEELKLELRINWIWKTKFKRNIKWISSRIIKPVVIKCEYCLWIFWLDKFLMLRNWFWRQFPRKTSIKLYLTYKSSMKSLRSSLLMESRENSLSSFLLYKRWCSIHTCTCQTQNAVVSGPRSLCILSLQYHGDFHILYFFLWISVIYNMLWKDWNKDYSSSDKTSILITLGKYNLATVI